MEYSDITSTARTLLPEFRSNISSIGYERKGILYSEILFMLACMKGITVQRVLESGRARAQSTLLLAKALPQSEILSIEYDPNSPDVPVATERLRGYSNVKQLFGDAREELPRLLEDGDVVIIDGPKMFRAIRLALNLLATGKTPFVFVHDVNPGTAERRFLDLCMPECRFSDSRMVAEITSAADESAKNMLPFNQWLEGFEGEYGYGFSLGCLPYVRGRSYRLLWVYAVGFDICMRVRGSTQRFFSKAAAIWKNVPYLIAGALPPANNTGIILLYHSVAKEGLSFSVRTREFSRQMQWLKSNNFNVVSLKELAGYRAAGSIPSKTIAITFDDGYEDNYTNAFPILQRHGFPASIFTTTGDIGSPGTMRIPLQKLSKAQMKEMEASGLVSIEPHTVSHKKLVHCSQEEARREVCDSKASLEGLLGKQCMHFAYPSGRENESVRTLVRECGFRCAYGVAPGCVMPASDPFALPRNAVDLTTTLTQFKGLALRGRLTRRRIFRV